MLSSSSDAPYFIVFFRNKVKGLAYTSEYKKLFSASEDQVLVVWDMKTKRTEVFAFSCSLDSYKAHSLFGYSRKFCLLTGSFYFFTVNLCI